MAETAEIIVIKQLPVIVEHLQMIKAEVLRKTNEAKALVCTEETVRAVKKARAELSAEFKEWEQKRGEVKRAIMSPYEQFETVYKDCVSDVFKEADAELKGKISEVESGLKAAKEAEVRRYFEEYAESRRIDFVSFERAGISITLSASLKSLKEQAKAFIDRVYADCELILTQERKEEIFVEYRQTLNASAAITAVVSRYKAIEEEKVRAEERERRQQAAWETERAEELIPPEPVITAPKIEETDPVLSLTFKVTAPKSKLKELKEFLINGGYDYE